MPMILRFISSLDYRPVFSQETFKMLPPPPSWIQVYYPYKCASLHTQQSLWTSPLLRSPVGFAFCSFIIPLPILPHWPKVVISCLNNCSSLQGAHLCLSFFCNCDHRFPLALNVALSGLASYCSASISKTLISHNGHLTCLIKCVCLNQGIKEGKQSQLTNLDLSHILFPDQSLCTCHSPNFAFQNDNYPQSRLC